jgi:hypothetical protein
MQLPSTITGVWIVIGLLFIGVTLVFIQTFWGGVFAVAIIAIVWYLLYAAGDRADNRIRRGQWGDDS